MSQHYEVRLTSSARRALELGLPEKVAAAAYEFLRGTLTENPRRVGKPLRNQLAGKWSARRGDYRVIYTVDDEMFTIMVLRIDHRRDAYRSK